MAVEHVASPSKYAPLIGFSSAGRAGDQVFVTGTTAVDGAGVVVGGEADVGPHLGQSPLPSSRTCGQGRFDLRQKLVVGV